MFSANRHAKNMAVREEIFTKKTEEKIRLKVSKYDIKAAITDHEITHDTANAFTKERRSGSKSATTSQAN